MTSDLQNKLDGIRRRLRDLGSVLVAYSGGVDSAVVAALAHRELDGRALACIGCSPSVPRREIDAATALASAAGFTVRVLETREQEDPNYTANGVDRCFFCRSHLFTRLREIAEAEGWAAVADGVHADDRCTHVNGIEAARRHGVISPLLEAGIGKAAVRSIAHYLGLPIWDKPAAACLASRVPHGTPITLQLLAQVESAEDAVARMGFRQFRVRHHGSVARLEVPPADLLQALQRREELVSALRAAGYQHVTLDLAGFRAEPDLRTGDEQASW